MRDAAAAIGVEIDIRTFERPMPTAVAAAEMLGCEVGRITKSLVFAAAGVPFVALTPGDRVADQKKLAAEFGVGRKKIRSATPEDVLRVTGFVVGGVAPCGHLEPVVVLVDEDLFRFATVFAAGGTAPTLFEIAPGDLVRLAETGGGRRVAISKAMA